MEFLARVGSATNCWRTNRPLGNICCLQVRLQLEWKALTVPDLSDP
jgi:hypothetical protein